MVQVKRNTTIVHSFDESVQYKIHIVDQYPENSARYYILINNSNGETVTDKYTILWLKVSRPTT